MRACALAALLLLCACCKPPQAGTVVGAPPPVPAPPAAPLADAGGVCELACERCPSWAGDGGQSCLAGCANLVAAGGGIDVGCLRASADCDAALSCLR